MRTGSAARLDTVPHRTETREGVRPFVARRAADHAQRARAAEAQPLHYGHGGAVLAADGVDPRFIGRQAVDPDRLRHRNSRVTHAGNRGGGLLREPAAVARLW